MLEYKNNISNENENLKKNLTPLLQNKPKQLSSYANNIIFLLLK